MLHREWSQSSRTRFGRFYLRRSRHPTPALALMVSVVEVISALVLSPIGGQETVTITAFAAMFLTANLVIARYSGGYFDTGAEKTRYSTLGLLDFVHEVGWAWLNRRCR